MTGRAEGYSVRCIEAALRCGALRLGGEFRLKSGTVSPYFFDTGRFDSGEFLQTLAEAFAVRVLDATQPDVPNLLFGPAYKGIVLAAATAIALARHHDVDVGYLFDRKEAKRHGEHSNDDPTATARKRLVGRLPNPGDRVVLLDDVLTTAQTKLDACRLLGQVEPGLEIAALVVALDREEVGTGGRTQAENFTAQTGIPVHSLTTAHELLDYARTSGQFDHTTVVRMTDYIATIDARLERPESGSEE